MAIKANLYQVKPIAMPVPSGLGGVTRNLAKPRKKFPLRKYGPKELKLFSKKLLASDWCTPPPAWVASASQNHSSNSEYMIYRALWRKLRGAGDPDTPPYDGGGLFQFQSPIAGGRLQRGGSVCDFVVRYGGEDICMRLQSERWHVQTDQAKRVKDFLLKTHTQGFKIVDIYEQDFIGDCTGETAVAVVAQALKGEDAPNPAALGTTKRVRS